MPSASPERLRALTSSRLKRLGIRLLVALIALYALYQAFMAFVNIRTNVLWFRSVDAGSVYGTILGAQILLFTVFGVLTALAVAAALRARGPLRTAVPPRPDPTEVARTATCATRSASGSG